MSQRYGLVGHPIEHSISPAMHNAGFKALGIDAHYVLRPTQKQGVPGLLREMQEGVWAGLNVTIPLKTIIAQHIEQDMLAARAGAVNTLVNQHGSWYGTNTDIHGILQPLLNMAFIPKHRNALILGAGGAARAALIAMEHFGLHCYIAARKQEAAQNLISHVKPLYGAHALTLDDARTLTAPIDIVLQATPVGRAGERHSLAWDKIHSETVAFEMLYKPATTPFLQDARSAGCVLIPGWKMLLNQGMRAFHLWTSREAPEAVMEKAITSQL